MEELIKIYEEIIFGANGHDGMRDCLSGYYSQCWDKQIEKAKALKAKINGKDT